MLVGLVNLGRGIRLNSQNDLTRPPLFNNAENIRYDSVEGNTGGSEIHIIYANNQAYPKYLITYQ